MQLLYGPNIGQSNNGCYDSRRSTLLREVAHARTRPSAIACSCEMTRQMEVDGAWSLHVSRERNQLIWPWVRGLQEAPDPAGRIPVPGHRPRDPSSDAMKLLGSRNEATCCLARLTRASVATLCSALLAAPAPSPARRRHEQGDPPRVSRGETGFDPAGAQRSLLGHGRAGDLRDACSPTTTSRGRRSSCR